MKHAQGIERDGHEIAARLRGRYPEIEIAAVYGGELTSDGVYQVCIEYRAPLARLFERGLVTNGMVENAIDGRRGSPTTPFGDGFTLCVGDGPGYPAALAIFTGTAPRERPRLALGEARRVLSRLMGYRVKG